MKTIFRFLSLMLVVTAGAVAGFAQDQCADVDGQNAIYTPFTETYNKKPYTAAETAKAIEHGKSFLEKFGSCESVKPQVDFIKGQLPRLEKRKSDLEKAAKYERFDNGVKAKNYDEVFAAGKDILSSNGQDSNIMVALALIGLDQTYQKNPKYNAEAINYAKSAIKVCPTATPKSNGAFGAFAFETKKENCASDLTFAIAHMMFWGQKDKAGALPFYYEVTQMAGPYKENAQVYEAIGTYYVEQSTPIGAEIAKLIEKQKAAKTDEEKVAIDGEIKPKVALFNGYQDRILDAYGRAHKYTKDATRKAAIYKELERVYQLRFDKKDGMDTYLATTVAKPLPNPTSTVEPVVEPDANTTTTTTTGTTTATPAPAPAAKPATTTPTKPMSTVGTKVSASATTGSVSGETVAKKPIAKKKGTR